MRAIPTRVEVVDSETGCGGLGLAVLAALARRPGGRVARGGRRGGPRRAGGAAGCGSASTRSSTCAAAAASAKAQSWIGGALKIKPILALEREITPIERVRTASRAFERMVEYMESLHEAGRDAWAIQHIRAADQADRLAERGRAIFGSEPLFVSEVGPVIGAHVGPGLLGVGGDRAGAARAMTTVWTIGYEHLLPPALAAELVEAGVERVLDVRYRPQSRRPGMSKTRLGEMLADHRIAYEHRRALGTPPDIRWLFKNRQVDEGREAYRAHVDGVDGVARARRAARGAARRPAHRAAVPGGGPGGLPPAGAVRGAAGA